MSEKIEHFGIQFQKRKYEFNLVESEYCIVNDKVSLMYFSEILIIKYEKFPKTFVLNYLSKLLKYYNGLEKLSSRQRKIKANASNVLMKIKDFNEKRHLSILKKYLKEDDKNNKEKLQELEKKVLSEADNYDLEKSIEGGIYSKSWCDTQEKEVKKNFEININYFNSLDQDEFENEINNFIKTNSEFKEISNLTNYRLKPGYYIMVLGKFKQIYVGTSYDIERRIITHWQKIKQFDRLIFPWHAVTASRLSIDSFRVLDTTRIFVYVTEDIYTFEEDIIQSFDPKFVLNRVTGGKLVVLPRKQIDLRG